MRGKLSDMNLSTDRIFAERKFKSEHRVVFAPGNFECAARWQMVECV